MQFSNAGARAKIYMYGDIGSDYADGLTAAEFAKALDAAGGKPVDIHVNSGGGDVFEAHAMHTAVLAYSGETVVHIDGIAASAASYFGLGADIITIAPHALMMIHKASMLTYGNADELRESAELLEALDNTLASIYAKKTGLDPQRILDMLKAETWLTAEDAVALGFADEIDEGVRKIAAKVDERISARWVNAPEGILQGEQPEPMADEAAQPLSDTDPAPRDEMAVAAEDAQERVVALSCGVVRFTDRTDEKEIL